MCPCIRKAIAQGRAKFFWSVHNTKSLCCYITKQYNFRKWYICDFNNHSHMSLF